MPTEYLRWGGEWVTVATPEEDTGVGTASSHYYPIGEDDGATATDQSGDMHLDVDGGTVVMDGDAQDGYYLEMAGGGADRLRAVNQDHLLPANSYSFACVMRTEDTSPDTGDQIFRVGDNSSSIDADDLSVEFRWSEDETRFNIEGREEGDDQDMIEFGDDLLADGDWHHVVVRWDGVGGDHETIEYVVDGEVEMSDDVNLEETQSIGDTVRIANRVEMDIDDIVVGVDEFFDDDYVDELIDEHPRDF